MSSAEKVENTSHTLFGLVMETNWYWFSARALFAGRAVVRFGVGIDERMRITAAASTKDFDDVTG